jgi:hypothetical protein
LIVAAGRPDGHGLGQAAVLAAFRLLTRKIGFATNLETRVAIWFIFKPKFPHFGLILDGLAIEDVSTFYGNLVNFTAIWYI